jgi:membrane-bound serine protease (ClpP class)
MPLMCGLTVKLSALLSQGSAAPASGDDRTFLIWGLVLLAAAITLLAVEMCVPASGTLALLGGLSLVGGIALLMWKGGPVGQIVAVLALASSPFVIIAILRFWPNTPVARLLTLQNSHTGDTEEEAPPGTVQGSGVGGVPGVVESTARVGVLGTAMTDLRPIGTCIIDGQRIECLADGPMIRAGSPVRVVAIDGIQTKVRVDEG